MYELAPKNHNQPPSLIEFSIETASALSDCLKKYPVIETEEQVHELKQLFDRSKDCAKDMKIECKARKKPHQEQIDLIDGEYRSPVAILDKMCLEALGRMGVWRRKEEEKRRAEAEEARKQAEEAEKRARDAEKRELEAKEEAKLGVETDLAAITRDADGAYQNYERAKRRAARSAMESTVKIRGGYRPALGESRFQKKERIVVDPNRALAVMGWSERLLEALKSDALQYRRDNGHLPDGIIEEISNA